MSIETLKNNLNKDVCANKVNVNILKGRVIEKQKKIKFQNRILLGSVLISIGLLGYFVT
tara:strand:- start:482 stop:658 length:177 start_codon:yes stop_codon:yes gene_type:complete